MKKQFILFTLLLGGSICLSAPTCYKYDDATGINYGCLHYNRASYEDTHCWDMSSGQPEGPYTCVPDTTKDDSYCNHKDLFGGSCGDGKVTWPAGVNSLVFLNTDKYYHVNITQVGISWATINFGVNTSLEVFSPGCNLDGTDHTLTIANSLLRPCDDTGCGTGVHGGYICLGNDSSISSSTIDHFGYMKLYEHASFSDSSFNNGKHISWNFAYPAITMYDCSTMDHVDMIGNDYDYYDNNGVFNSYGPNILMENDYNHTCTNSVGLSHVLLRNNKGYGIIVTGSTLYANDLIMGPFDIYNNEYHPITIGNNVYPGFASPIDLNQCCSNDINNCNGIVIGEVYKKPGVLDGNVDDSNHEKVRFFSFNTIHLNPDCISTTSSACTGHYTTKEVVFDGLWLESDNTSFDINPNSIDHKAIVKNCTLTSYIDKTPGEGFELNFGLGNVDFLNNVYEYGNGVGTANTSGVENLCIKGNTFQQLNPYGSGSAILDIVKGPEDNFYINENNFIDNPTISGDLIYLDHNRLGSGQHDIENNCFLNINYSYSIHALASTPLYAKIRNNIFYGPNYSFYHQSNEAAEDLGMSSSDPGENMFYNPSIASSSTPCLNCYLESGQWDSVIPAYGNYYYDTDDDASNAINKDHFELELADDRWIMRDMVISSIDPKVTDLRTQPLPTTLTINGSGFIDMVYRGDKLMKVFIDDNLLPSSRWTCNHTSGTHETVITILNPSGEETSPGQHHVRVEVDECGINQRADGYYYIISGNGSTIGNYYISVNEGTTAGGTNFFLISDTANGGQVFYPDSNILFDPDNCSITTCDQLCPDDHHDELDAEVIEYIDDHTLYVTTMQSLSETGNSILIDANNDGFICSLIKKSNQLGSDDDILYQDGSGRPAFSFKTLAYTANQVTQDVSVVDTVDNQLFPVKESIPMDTSVVPMGMAYSRVPGKEGRMLYIVDYNTGNLPYFDISNFQQYGEVVLQDPNIPKSDSPGAFDIAVSSGGDLAFVSHITLGFMDPWDPTGNPKYGGVSVLTIDNEGVPTLYDVDQDPSTTKLGAPEGYSRLHMNPVPGAHYFYPLSLKSVMITDDIDSYNYQDGEKHPGEYIFVSAVEWLSIISDPACQPGEPCVPIFFPRPVSVAIIDNNKSLYCDPSVHPTGFCDDATLYEPGGAYYNNDYWDTLDDAYKIMGAGIDGKNLGETSQGLGFSLSAGPDGKPTVYLLNEMENRAYMIEYDQATSDWTVVMNGGTPDTIQTGSRPTDVKVQGTNLGGGPWKTYAYITNAEDDTVTVIDTATNTEIGNSPIHQDDCFPVDHYATSFDTRSKGDFGYSSDFHSNTVSVIDLPNSSMNQPPYCQINVGEAPIRIVVQPVPGWPKFFRTVRNALAFASGDDFTTPSKQSNLIRDWEDVHQLQETSANPEAVVANIDAFSGKVDRWIVDPALKEMVTRGVTLYRARYIYENPLPGNGNNH